MDDATVATALKPDVKQADVEKHRKEREEFHAKAFMPESQRRAQKEHLKGKKKLSRSLVT